MNRSRPAESKIVEAVMRLLRNIGFEDILKEAQFCERYLDLFAKEKNNFIAVEAKVASPTKAFEQAARYVHLADHVYVGAFSPHKNSVCLRMAKKTGIGLISVTKDKIGRFKARIMVDAKKSSFYDPLLAEDIWRLNTVKA